MLWGPYGAGDHNLNSPEHSSSPATGTSLGNQPSSQLCLHHLPTGTLSSYVFSPYILGNQHKRLHFVEFLNFLLLLFYFISFISALKFPGS